MTLKFMYFDFMVRSLPNVLGLEIYGLPWERQTFESWPEQKQKTNQHPFGQIPVLIDDEIVVAHTIAIGNYIAKKANRVPDNTKDQVMSDMLLSEFETLLRMILEGSSNLFSKLGESGKKGVEYSEKTEREIIPTQLGYLEALINAESARFTESGDSIGEIFLFSILHQIVQVFPTILDDFTGVKTFYNDFLSNPKVENALSGKSNFGEFKTFFLPESAVAGTTNPAE